MGTLVVRCALASDVLRRARELVAMCEEAAPMHAVCLARGPLDGRDLASIEIVLRAERDAVVAACAALERIAHLAEGRPVGDEVSDVAVLAMISRVSTELARMLEHARDADAAIDPVLARELEDERRRWASMARDPGRVRETVPERRAAT